MKKENSLGLIVIMNVWKRKKEGEYLKRVIQPFAEKAGVQVKISYDNGTLGLWGNFSKSLIMSGNKGTHRLIIHDDVIFDRNVLQKVIELIKFIPEKSFLSIYNPWNNDYLKALEKKKRILKTKNNFWLQSCIYPDKESLKFLDWVGKNIKNEYKWEDRRLIAYLESTDRFMYAVVPGLTQHIGAYRSSFKIAGKIGKRYRYSGTYNSSQESEIDWLQEFKNPYKTTGGYDSILDLNHKNFLLNYNSPSHGGKSVLRKQ